MMELRSRVPDGPVADDLLAQGGSVFARAIPQMPEDMLVRDPVGQGQAGLGPGQRPVQDGGVNAQSDHTPFIAAGVPSGRTPWRTMRSQSAGVNTAVRPPSPAVMLGPRIRPIMGSSTMTPPPKSFPWHSTQT